MPAPGAGVLSSAIWPVCHQDAWPRPFRNALLVSVTVHLVFFFGGVRPLADGAGKSGVSGKKLQPLNAVIKPVNSKPVVASFRPGSGFGSDRLGSSVSPRFRRSATLPPFTSFAVRSTPLEASGRAAEPAETPVPGAPEPLVSNRDSVPAEGDSDAVRGYRIALAIEARRFRLYPPTAKGRGIGGRAEIEIVFPASGLAALRVVRSTGNRELDTAALEMLRLAVDSVVFPAVLAGRQLSLSLPVEFVPPP